MNMPDGFKLLGKLAPLWKGRYDPKAFYTFMDIVQYKGSSYMAKKDYPEGTPEDDGKNWILIASKGDKGDGGVTRIRGIAEKDFRDGDVVLSPDDIGLGNVANLDVDGILANITLELLESVLGINIKTLKHKLHHKVDDTTDLVNGIRGMDDPEGEYHQGYYEIGPKSVGLEKVDNLSSDELMQKVRETVTASELGGLTKVDDLGFTGLYASDGDETKTLELIEDIKKLVAFFEDEDENKPQDEIISAAVLIHFLKKYYRHFIERQFLEDFHPLLKIRGEAEKVWQSDKYVVTKRGIGLENVPNVHPDSIGSGFEFSGFCESEGSNPEKLCLVQGQFSLKPGRTIKITFKNTNTTGPIFLNVNRTGRRGVLINGKSINKHNKSSFKKDGTYIFRYEHGSWNLISGSTKIENVHKVTVLKSKWKETINGYIQFIPLPDLYGDEDFLLTSENLSEEERQNYILAGIDGVDQSNRGIHIRAENLPYVDLPMVIKITR